MQSAEIQQIASEYADKVWYISPEIVSDLLYHMIIKLFYFYTDKSFL